MVIILSTPPVAPPVPLATLRELTHEWVAWNGERYALSDWTTGIVMDNRGVEGMHFPIVTKFSSSSRAFPGKRPRGWRTEARDVFWPLQIWADSSSEWLERYRAFFDTIHPEREGTWRVGVDGEFRELRLTGVFSEAHQYELDPLLEAWSPYGVELEASQPYWAGATVSRGPWQAPAPVSFFDAAGSPPFHISTGGTFESAQIPNTGDVEAWPVWTIRGPLDPVEVGVGDAIVEIPFPVLDGQVLRIDTDPRNVTATLDGVDVSPALGFQRFAPVAPGQDVPLHVSAVGTGSVGVELTPLFFRAF